MLRSVGRRNSTLPPPVPTASDRLTAPREAGAPAGRSVAIGEAVAERESADAG